MDLTNQKIEDTYGNVLTIGSVAGSPTEGVLENGAGNPIDLLTLKSIKYDQSLVTASGTDISTTTILNYGVSLISATSGNYALRLPEPSLGGVVGIVNNSSVDVYVFPYDAGDTIVGLSAGEPYVIPPDSKLYNITCVQNPVVGILSVSTPTSNNTVKKTVSINLIADGTHVDGNFSYSSTSLLNASKSTFTLASGSYDILDAPTSNVDYFDTPEFNNYNKVRLTNVIVKSNVPAGDLTNNSAQYSSTLMGLTSSQLNELFGYIRIAILDSGTTITLNDYNTYRYLDYYSGFVYSGISTNYVSSYMGSSGLLYQQLNMPTKNSSWHETKDANGNRSIYYSPFIGYGSSSQPQSNYPLNFSFEVEIIAEFEFSM